jgi:hypothetical protein
MVEGLKLLPSTSFASQKKLVSNGGSFVASAGQQYQSGRK